MIDRLREIDVTLSLSLNPLNWRLRSEVYGTVAHGTFGYQVEAGPFSVLVLW